MSVFHVPSVCANANSRALGALERLSEHVGAFHKGLSARWEANREAFESTLRDTTVVPEEAVTVGVALRDLSSRGHRPRQRGGVSLQTCRMTNQCQSYTRTARARTTAAIANRWCWGW